MNIQSWLRNQRNISLISTVVIFLALTRCVTEPFRLQAYNSKLLTVADIKPYLAGAIVTSIALLAMTILSFAGKYRMVTVLAVLTVAILVLLKVIFKTP